MSRLPARKKRRLRPPNVVKGSSAERSESRDEPILEEAFFTRAAEWDLEQDYELRPRKQSQAKESLRLPIKTADGWIEQVAHPMIEDDIKVSDSYSEEEEDSEAHEDTDVVALKTREGIPPKQHVAEAKEELARIAGAINESPQEQVGSLRTLAEITDSANSTVKKLGLATQFAVYKDIIPGYRIRQLEDDELKSKPISKDVRQLRSYEQTMASGYQKYVQELGRIARLRSESVSEDVQGLSSAAISCVCNLLNAVPHFNFRGELLKVVVSTLGSKKKDENFDRCCKTLEHLFANDDEGNSSLEAVQILAKMIRTKNHLVHERVLNLFLHLRLLKEFSHKASTTQVNRKDDESPEQGKKQKDKREFRTKKERKLLRERRGIEKEMKEADAVVSYEQRDKLQAETLKIVFGVYFRILKARTTSLIGPVLEGLVKYAHLINQDFFGDLLEALKDLIRETDAGESHSAIPSDTTELESNEQFARNATRESLLCVITAFALLQGQDGSASTATTLNLDLSFFISHLYRTLLPASLNADVELSSKSLRLPDPHSSTSSQSLTTRVDVSTTIVLLLRSLQAILLPSHIRSVPPLRLAAFSKKVLTSSLHLPEKSCTAILGLMNQVVKMHKKKFVALWNTEERRGDGVYDPLRSEVEGSNPFAATVWEGELLRLHYAQPVREGLQALEELVTEK